MKKILKLGAVAAVAALSLAACGEAPDKAAPESGAEGGAVATSDFKACMVSDEGGFDDKSFNQSGHEGLVRAEQELGIQIRDAESHAEEDHVPNLDSMVQEGCDLIIGVGFIMEDALADAAEANPDVKFALVDSDVPGDHDNAKGLLFNTAEAAYLAGYAAAGMSETGKVGAFLGMNIPPTAIFADGYAQGVDHYNEEHGTDVEVLGWDLDKQDGVATGDFADPSKGKQFAQQLIDQGADVIMPVAGNAGVGALAAAEENTDVAIVWVDADGVETQPEYAEVILTSVLKEISNAVFDTIKETMDGNFSSDAYVGTLANEGVGIAPWHDFADKVPAELQEEIDQVREDIINGDLVVESVNQAW